MINYKVLINFIIIGACTGILLGLSLSPVIGQTLGVLLPGIVTIVGIFSGLNSEDSSKISRYKLNPLPLTMIMIGIVLGSILGMHLRINNIIKRNKDSSDVIKSSDSAYINVTGLNNGLEVSTCENLKNLHGSELKGELQKLGNSLINSRLDVSSDSLTCELLKELICK